LSGRFLDFWIRLRSRRRATSSHYHREKQHTQPDEAGPRRGMKALIRELPEENHQERRHDIMTWAFVGGTLDPENRTPQNSLFLFCMEPRKLLTMMDGLDDLTGEERRLLQRGMDMMRRIRRGSSSARIGWLTGKRSATRSTGPSFNYVDMVFKLKIIGVFSGRPLRSERRDEPPILAERPFGVSGLCTMGRTSAGRQSLN